MLNHTAGHYLVSHEWNDRMAGLLESFAQFYTATAIVITVVIIALIFWLCLSEMARPEKRARADRRPEPRRFGDERLLAEESSVC